MTVSEDVVPPSESVRVVIQSRPLLPFELAHDAKPSISINSSPPTISVYRAATLPGISNNSINTTDFTAYDAVYDAQPNSKPDDLYDTHVLPLMQSIYQGINATIFAYGQTCAGKSYTMKHITSRVVSSIFETKQNIEEQGDYHVNIRVAFVEIYRESIRDLVDGTSEPLGAVHINLRSRTNNNNNNNNNQNQTKRNMNNNNNNNKSKSTTSSVFLDGAKEKFVNDKNHLLSIIEEGSLVRRTATTGMNASSSRSHSIITVSIIQQPINSEDKQCLTSKIHLVDLAGSERAKRTNVRGARFAEGVDINKGLFALAKVISTLADNSKRPPSSQLHVPYRDSKLTRLLQDSLGGSSRTLLIACISPANTSTEETLSTLRYAERAKQIKNKPKVNRDINALEISDLRAALSRARAKIAALAVDNERLKKLTLQGNHNVHHINKQVSFENHTNNFSICPNCSSNNVNNDNSTDGSIDIEMADKVNKSMHTIKATKAQHQLYNNTSKVTTSINLNDRLPKRSKTQSLTNSNINNHNNNNQLKSSQTQLRKPLRNNSVRRLPRRAAIVNMEDNRNMSRIQHHPSKARGRSPLPSVDERQRRRSKSVTTLRAAGTRLNSTIKQDFEYNTSVSPCARSDARRKRFRTTGISTDMETSSSPSATSSSSSSSMEDDEDGSNEDDDERATAKAIGRTAASTLNDSKFEEMRRTFTERLQQAENDKADIDASRNELLQTIRQISETHSKEMEDIKSSYGSKINKLRTKLADTKKLEAESTRLNKLKNGNEAVRKKLEGKVLQVEKQRDEMISRLSEALSRTEVSKLNLGKENKVLIRSERQLRVELQKVIDAKTKMEASVIRLRAENDVLKQRSNHNNSNNNNHSNHHTQTHTPPHNNHTNTPSGIRRVNSSYTPSLGIQQSQNRHYRQARALRE